jgi:hypothetical protein
VTVASPNQPLPARSPANSRFLISKTTADHLNAQNLNRAEAKRRSCSQLAACKTAFSEGPRGCEGYRRGAVPPATFSC